MPYSISVPITRRTVTGRAYAPPPSGRSHSTGDGGCDDWSRTATWNDPRSPIGPKPQTPAPRARPAKSGLQVLTGVGDRVDRPAGLGALLAGDQGTDEHDPLALLARDPRPV